VTKLSLIGEKLNSDGERISERTNYKIRGSERVSRPAAEKKESFPKQRSVERLISLLGIFHRKMNNVRKLEPVMGN